MVTNHSGLLRSILKVVVCLLILEVTWSNVAIYKGYFPADFSTDFLLGRESYFYAAYQYAFYPHIFVGPLTLILGLFLINNRYRQYYPRWHRTLGKTQIALILLFLTPSGFWMAWYAPLEFVGKLGFALLAVLTGATAWFGWRSAVQRRFAQHQIWMTRNYVLLCSAVVTRILGGFFTVMEFHADWTYYLAAWGSWVVPLVIYEVLHSPTVRRLLTKDKTKHRTSKAR